MVITNVGESWHNINSGIFKKQLQWLQMESGERRRAEAYISR